MASELAHQMSNIAIGDTISPIDASASMRLSVKFQHGGCFYNEDSHDNYMAMVDYFYEQLHQRTAPNSKMISDDTWEVDASFDIGDRIEECINEISKEMEWYPTLQFQLYTQNEWYREERTIWCNAEKKNRNIVHIGFISQGENVAPPIAWKDSWSSLLVGDVVCTDKSPSDVTIESAPSADLSFSRVLHTIAMIAEANYSDGIPDIFTFDFMCSDGSGGGSAMLYLDLTKKM